MKAILFDFDDTLVQTRESKWEALIETARRYYNLQIDANHISQFWGLPFEKMITGVMKNIDDFESIRDNYFVVTHEFPMLAHIGAVEAIVELMKTYPVGILTASDRELVIDDLTRLKFPVANFFNIQTAEDTKVHKPNPDVFLPTLAKQPSLKLVDFLYVGDSIRDYLAAKNAGLDFIGISHQGESEFAKKSVKYVNSFEELINNLLYDKLLEI